MVDIPDKMMAYLKYEELLKRVESIFMKIAMDLADYTMHTLLLGSLLHDVGMFCIPKTIFTTKDLVEVEQRYILAHPIHGYNVIVKELHYPNQIGLIALQHHEYWNGTG
ncbi:MAG: HD domain-containing protein, partial [Treponema sp.]|nr:HD domain-containing protein [Treponema sp.]